ncbi:MAG: hypothetical protein HUJ22_02860 [Gracilimonas sp.]|uniref:hypothetical protein n=1 Tax=Gracilimonas sp. TaxID=1974203 RepID=UPI0019AA887A|nr:hypothetical protein [Gracilimonas sp.]MBD3615486.1 hypothetical protein [Gracilimonas sp.]
MIPSITHKSIFFNKPNNLFGLASAIIIFLFLGLFFTNPLSAQEINFGEFSSEYGVTISELNPSETLNFGMTLQNEGLKSIDLFNAKVLMIEGVKYLDVLVDISADNYLYLDNDVSCNASFTNCIPFTLQAAYANRGSNDTNQAVLMQVTSNMASAQFPILARGNRPPGPPPTPPHEGYNPAVFNETAYLYIYGSLNVGIVNSGSYTGNITITVSYD